MFLTKSKFMGKIEFYVEILKVKVMTRPKFIEVNDWN